MRTLGVELGHRVLRMVVADVRRGRLELHEAAAVAAAPGASGVAAAIAGFISEHGRGVQQVVVGLPPRDSLVRIVRFPATSEENLARLARSAAETVLPVPLAEASLGHAVIDPGDGDEATVALVACRRAVASELVAALTAAGLRQPVLGVSGLALANLFAAEARASGRPLAVVELAEDEVELVILDGRGRLRQLRSLAGDPSEIPLEVRRSCQTFAAAGEGVAELLLVGPGALDAEPVLAEELPFPVRLGDPWQGSGQGLSFDGQAAAFAVATGLAMHGDSALQVDLRPKEPAVARRRENALAGLALALVTVALVGSVLFGVSRYRQRQDQARLVAEQVAQAERNLAALGGEDPAFLAKLAATAEQVRDQRDWLDFLRDLSLQLPAGVSLEELTTDRARPVVLRGQARSNAAIAQSMDVLNGLGWFDTARLDYANADRIGNELVYNFQITCPWREAARPVKEAG